MPLKYQYTLFIILLHAVVAGLTYYILRDDKWYFLLSEILMIFSLYLSYRLYHNFIKPIDLMKSGVNAIKEEDFSVKFLNTGSGEINDLIEVFNTMLERLGEEKVRTQEQAYFLESIINASPIGMIILDYDDCIAEINPAARNLLSVKDVILKMKLEELQHPLTVEINKMEVGESAIISTEGFNKYKCQVSYIIHKGFKRRFIMIEEFSKEILENEKAAYGKVIRMMAHEVNNSMGAVNSILQSVIDFGFDESEEDQEYVESLNIARDRNMALAGFMKNFAEVIRVPEPHLKRVTLQRLIQDCFFIMKPQLDDRNIKIEFSKDKDVDVMIDSVLMEQVLVNILKNSMESIDENGAITIKINDSLPQLIIIDNGAGILPEDQPNLFTPFFSTKPTGQGIGLMLIREILMKHKADFKLYTDQRTGLTHFEIGFY